MTDAGPARSTSSGARRAGRPLVVVLCAAIPLVLGTALLAPSDLPAGETPVGLVVGHPVVVGALRSLVLVLALFLTASAVALALGGRWVRRVGPVDATAEVVEVASDGEALRAELDRAEAEVERLTGELATAMDLLDEVADTSGAGERQDGRAGGGGGE